ncbi:MAG: nucleotidyltransferase [Clostridiales bacterium]|nr:nucleotidyltransferase [Clostridiales bacterium]
MLKVLGIVAEYNPFHNGHLYHLEKAKDIIKPDFTVAVMSGNFTQRGEPAIIDKWSRTKMALENGIDLVLELPVLYACQTAELFSAAAVRILNSTGIITHMAFGSEYDNINHLKTLAQILYEEPPQYRKSLKLSLRKGLSFPNARLNALKEYFSQLSEHSCLEPNLIDTILVGSNSILALEYLKILIELRSTIQPVIIPRIGSQYNTYQIETPYSSATAIRHSILSSASWDTISPSLPSISLKILKDEINMGQGPVALQSIEQILLGIIRRSTLKEISQWMDVEEGLEYRIKKSANGCTNITNFLIRTKTKRYTLTRLQRILIHGLLDIKTTDTNYFENIGGPPYIRVLGFNMAATRLLRALKEKSKLPIINKAAHYFRHGNKDIDRMFQYEILAGDLYALGYPNPGKRKGGQEFTRGLIRIHPQ